MKQYKCSNQIKKLPNRDTYQTYSIGDRINSFYYGEGKITNISSTIVTVAYYTGNTIMYLFR